MVKFGRIFLILLLVFAATISGTYATWRFSEAPATEKTNEFGVQMNEFTFAPKETLQIVAVSLISTNNASSTNVGFTHPTYLDSTINSRQTSATVTYKVTVWNNTAVTYWYLGLTWEQGIGANDMIGVSRGITITTKDNSDDNGNTFNTEDWVPPYTERDFYVTYTFGSNAVASGLATELCFNFGMKMDAVQDEFLAVLNDSVSAYGYHYLEGLFNDQYQENGSMVIANVGDDAEIFSNLFGGTPTVTIDGKEVPVTIMIERKNVDGRGTGDSYEGNGAPTGCEYTLYVSVDPMNSSTGEAMVYAVSYSCGGEGDTEHWYQLGQLYEGTTPLTEYGDTGKLAFDLENWKATANEYEFIDGYYYKVGYEQGDQYAKYKTIEELMSANDQNFYNDIDNSQLLRKVYAIVYKSANANKPGYEGLKTAFENAAPFYTVHNGGQEVKIKRQATRAELLPYIVAIQHEYTYYLQVNP